MILFEANIVFPLLVESANTRSVKELLDRDAVWVTEPYALIELTNILVTYERADLLSKTQAMELLQRATGFLQPYFMLMPHELVLDIAMRYKISAYDARYIALAEKLNGNPLAAAMVGNFLSAPPSERAQLVQEYQATSWGQKYFGQMAAIAGTCNNY